MIKKIIMFGIVVLLICIGLSGCNEQDNNEDIQKIANKFIGKWFEEGKNNQYMHFFRNGTVKDTEHVGTWTLTKDILTLNIPTESGSGDLMPIQFNYRFSNDGERLTLNIVDKPLYKFHYTKEDAYVQPD